MSMGGRGRMPDIPQDSNKPQRNPKTTEPAEETTSIPNEVVQTTQLHPPEMNGGFPEFNGELPPNFNGQMPPMNGNQTA